MTPLIHRNTAVKKKKKPEARSTRFAPLRHFALGLSKTVEQEKKDPPCLSNVKSIN